MRLSLISAALSLVSCTALTFPSAGIAQESATYLTKAYPISKGGTVVGCALEFEAGVLDYVYRQGGGSLINGSMNFYGYREREAMPYIALKMYVEDVSTDGKKSNPNAPTELSIFGKSGEHLTSARGRTISGDMPGSTLAIFEFDGHFADVMKSIIEDNVLPLGFNRKVGGMDVKLPVDLTVDATGAPNKSSETKLSFTRCLSPLLEEVQMKLSSRP